MNITRHHVAIELIDAIADHVQACGHDVAALHVPQIVHSDADDQAGSIQDGYADFALFSRLFDVAGCLTGDPCIGLRVGGNFLARHWGRLGYLVMAGDNGLEGVQFLQRFARIVTNGVQLQWHWREQELICEFSLLEQPCSHHVADYFVASSLALARATQHADFAFKQVRFQHGDQGQAAEYQALLQTDCRFGCDSNQVIVDAAMLNQVSRHRDPRLKKILQAHAEQVLQTLASGDELVQRIRQHVLSELANGVPSLKAVAERTGQNERALQRALARLNLNYQDMVDELRMHLALEYIRNDYSFLDIAMLLGYSEQSAFHRAFKRWTGMPPSGYKKSRLG